MRIVADCRPVKFCRFSVTVTGRPTALVVPT
jgi:hypothetical protein